MPTNVPQTVWQPTDGLTEFSNQGISYIVDPFGIYLVDPTATYIVDTGVLANLIPATIWEENDGV